MTKRLIPKRNDVLFDSWSIVHLCFGIAFGYILPPVIAITALVLWEPLEIFIISPLVAKIGITFGFETIRNSLSDIIFDIAGVALGVFLLQHI